MTARDMTFSDDDLKRLKDNDYELFGFSKEHIKALPARLEAAEDVIYHAGLIRGPGTDALINIWHKAAGK